MSGIEWTDVTWNPVIGRWRSSSRWCKGADPSEWPDDLRVQEFPREEC